MRTFMIVLGVLLVIGILLGGCSQKIGPGTDPSLRNKTQSPPREVQDTGLGIFDNSTSVTPPPIPT